MGPERNCSAAGQISIETDDQPASAVSTSRPAADSRRIRF